MGKPPPNLSPDGTPNCSLPRLKANFLDLLLWVTLGFPGTHQTRAPCIPTKILARFTGDYSNLLTLFLDLPHLGFWIGYTYNSQEWTGYFWLMGGFALRYPGPWHSCSREPSLLLRVLGGIL